MKIDARTAIADYKALRGGSNEISLSATPAEILKSQTDNDPATEDVLVASTWSGSFSDPGGTVTFREQNQTLKIECSSSTSLFEEPTVASATIDLNTSSFTSHNDTDAIQFIVAEPTIAPQAPDQHKELRETYAQIKDAVANGQTEFQAGVSNYELKESRPGYIQVTSWDGGFSSPTVTETFEEKAGQLIYTRFTPGSPFMVGSEDETVTRTLKL